VAYNCPYERRVRKPSALAPAILAIVFVLTAPAVATAGDARSAPAAETDKGRVIGLREGGIAEFRGIPYAAAPTGALRFRPPQPRAAWSQPLDATQFGSACPQSARLGTPSVNEDCLLLNVYTPLSEAKRRPVLVFIHGGSFNAGSGGVAPNGPDYRGNDIAARSGAIVVTINYRLSILGFLAAPALDAENDYKVSSNYGLQDQQEALRWVQRNIAGFGGDPATSRSSASPPAASRSCITWSRRAAPGCSSARSSKARTTAQACRSPRPRRWSSRWSPPLAAGAPRTSRPACGRCRSRRS
jgi:para-nitrobenzyl esterase